MSNSRNSGETMLAFLLGGIVGAAVGILFAPRPGKETREKLKVLLEDLGEKADVLLEEGKEKVEDIVQEAKGKFAFQRERTK